MSPNPPQRTSSARCSPQEVIDPNLYGPFGHRYHESTSHSRHQPQPATTTSWHDVPVVDPHQRLGSTTAAKVGNGAQSDDGRTCHGSTPFLHQSVPSERSSAISPQLESHNSYVPDLSYIETRTESMFDIVHAKEGSKLSTKPYIAKQGEDVPINLRHLFKRPIIRQWLHGNRLYRETDSRKSSQFELVFDLIFVAVVNGLGHATAESDSGINVLKFVLSFWPCFSIWTDVRLFLNTSGTDDVLERLLLLGWMVLLCGYTANISGVTLVYATPELLARLHVEELAGDAPAQKITQGIAGELEAFVRRAGASIDTAETVELSMPAFGGYWFTAGYEKAIHAAISFYLVAKLWRLGIYVYYGFALPKFRKALWLNALATGFIAGIYVPITLTDRPLLIVLLLSVGILVEMARNYVVAAAMKMFHRQSKRRGSNIFIPAQSHEHSMERYVLFVILIVGESIMSSTFVAAPGSYGLNAEFGRASLGIAISVLVIWTYYDADGSRVYQHALKRNSFTSITFCHIHYPLTAALILMASSLSTLISNTSIHGGYVWYFGGSLSCVMVCLCSIGLMHRNLDQVGSTLVPRWTHMVVRFAAAIIFATLPLKADWDTLQLMGTVTSVLAVVVLFETFGKLGAVGRRFDPDQTIQLYAHMADQDEKHLQLSRRASWHPFDDLTPGERGESDVGIESEIGHVEEKDLVYGQRWAYAA